MSTAARLRWERILQPLVKDIFRRIDAIAPRRPEDFLEAGICEQFRRAFEEGIGEVQPVALARIARELRIPVQWDRQGHLALQPIVCRRLAENAFWRANQIAYLQHVLSPIPSVLEELAAQPHEIPETLYHPVYAHLRKLLRKARDQLQDLEDVRTPGRVDRTWRVTDRFRVLEGDMLDLKRLLETFRKDAPIALRAQQPVTEPVSDFLSRTLQRVQQLGFSGAK